MEDFIAKITDKVGISEEQAKKVWTFLQEHSDDVIEWVSDSDIADTVKKKLPGGLGNLF